MLFASRQAIRGVSLDSAAPDLTPPEAIPPIVNADSTFVAVDYDSADDYIYYSNVRRSSIHRVHTDGTGRCHRRLKSWRGPHVGWTQGGYIFYAGGSLAVTGYCWQCRRRPAILLLQLWQSFQVCVEISAQRPSKVAQFNAR